MEEVVAFQPVEGKKTRTYTIHENLGHRRTENTVGLKDRAIMSTLSTVCILVQHFEKKKKKNLVRRKDDEEQTKHDMTTWGNEGGGYHGSALVPDLAPPSKKRLTKERRLVSTVRVIRGGCCCCARKCCKQRDKQKHAKGATAALAYTPTRQKTMLLRRVS